LNCEKWRAAIPGKKGPTSQPYDETNKRITIMRKNFSIALTFLMLVGSTALLGACQTTAGAGEDISAGGKALTNSAEKHAP
jgi:predicted small secreted protein